MPVSYNLSPRSLAEFTANINQEIKKCLNGSTSTISPEPNISTLLTQSTQSTQSTQYTHSTKTPRDDPSLLPKYKVLPQGKNSSRPGPLIIDGRFWYFCTRVLGEEGDKKCFYTCSNRRSTGCKANAQLVDGVGTGDTQYLLFKANIFETLVQTLI